MADNITSPLGTLASKDIGGVQYPQNIMTDEEGDDLSSFIKTAAPADDVFAITPGTSPLANIPKALLVTQSGTLSVGGVSNTPVSLGSVGIGQIIPLRARYVYASGTTATVVGLI